MKVAVGIDLGGTKLLGALVSEDGKLLARMEEPTKAARGPQGVIGAIAAFAIGLEAAGKKLGHEPLGVGIGAPGPIDPGTGVVWAMPNLGPAWRRYPLRASLQAALPGRKVAIENDANAAMLGEAWVGAAAGSLHAVLLTLGTGVGGGIITGGILVRGARGAGAELGHVIVQRGGYPCGCGAKGCLEQHASGTAVSRLAQEAVARGAKGALASLGHPPSAHEVVAAARAGDEAALSVLHEAGSALGVALISILHALNPEIVAIGGGFGMAAFDLLVPVARAEIEKGSFEASREGVSIVPAKLGADAGAVGAARAIFFA